MGLTLSRYAWRSLILVWWVGVGMVLARARVCSLLISEAMASFLRSLAAVLHCVKLSPRARASLRSGSRQLWSSLKRSSLKSKFYELLTGKSFFHDFESVFHKYKYVSILTWQCLKFWFRDKTKSDRSVRGLTGTHCHCQGQSLVTLLLCHTVPLIVAITIIITLARTTMNCGCPLTADNLRFYSIYTRHPL